MLDRTKHIKVELPVGLLVFTAAYISEEDAILTGVWYYKEDYVPTTKNEKVQAIADLKRGICRVLIVRGTFAQICNVLSQSDKILNATEEEIIAYDRLWNQIQNNGKPFTFDDIKNMSGTSLAVDTVIPVEETLDDIQEQIKSKKGTVYVTISKNWSLSSDILKSLD